MVVVDFECRVCGHVFEEYIKDLNIQTLICPKCTHFAKRIITFNTGHRADPTWLESACELLQPDFERPIESREEFNKYLKEHDIVQRC